MSGNNFLIRKIAVGTVVAIGAFLIYGLILNHNLKTQGIHPDQGLFNQIPETTGLAEPVPAAPAHREVSAHAPADDPAIAKLRQFLSEIPQDEPNSFDGKERLYEAIRSGQLDQSMTVNDELFDLPIYTDASPDSYPRYALECNNGTCYNSSGFAIGEVADIVGKMTPVMNRDALRPDWKCEVYCEDAEGNIVGAVQPRMAKWLKLRRELVSQ